MRRRGSAALPGLVLIGLAAAGLGWKVAPHLAGPGIVAPARAGIAEIEVRVPAAPRPPAFAPPPLDPEGVVARNLFALARRPVPPPAPPADPAAPPRTPELGLRLIGIAHSTGGGLAVLSPAGGGAAVMLAPGARHRGWVLERLSERAAIFTHGRQVERLQLDFAAPR